MTLAQVFWLGQDYAKHLKNNLFYLGGWNSLNSRRMDGTRSFANYRRDVDSTSPEG